MKPIPLILADEDYGKLIGFVIVAIIWGIGALASMLNKAAKKFNQQVPRPTAAPPPLPQSPAARRTMVEQKRKPAPARRTPATPQQRPQARPVAKAAIAPARPSSLTPAPEISPITGSAAARAVATGASAGAIRKWLRPDSLRKQFILTELLQPSLALRTRNEDLAK